MFSLPMKPDKPTREFPREHPVFVYLSCLWGKGEAFGLLIYQFEDEIYRPNAIAPTL